jgi:hypothetical protein
LTGEGGFVLDVGHKKETCHFGLCILLTQQKSELKFEVPKMPKVKEYAFSAIN